MEWQWERKQKPKKLIKEVNMKQHSTDVKRLHKLDGLDDYEVSDNDPDIVDWKVYTSDKIEFGEVTDLIVDLDQRKAVYADIIVADDFIHGENESHLLIPLDTVTLHEKNKMVIVSTITSEDLANYPMYNGSSIPSEYEQTLREKIMQGKRGSSEGNTGKSASMGSGSGTGVSGSTTGTTGTGSTGGVGSSGSSGSGSGSGTFGRETSGGKGSYGTGSTGSSGSSGTSGSNLGNSGGAASGGGNFGRTDTSSPGGKNPGTGGTGTGGNLGNTGGSFGTDDDDINSGSGGSSGRSL
jgi:hypothetical protein